MAMRVVERFRGCLLGLAAGDALGTTLEFCPRGTFEPLTDMVGGGPFRLQAGQWTDDTSLALCLATSLVDRGGFDAEDQMNRYCRWAEDGYLSSTGVCFDIGNTVASALRRYREHGNPYAGSDDPNMAGNGCLMRLAPIPMYFFPELELAEEYAARSSRTTHGAAECMDACRLFARIVCRALPGISFEVFIQPIQWLINEIRYPGQRLIVFARLLVNLAQVLPEPEGSQNARSKRRLKPMKNKVRSKCFLETRFLGTAKSWQTIAWGVSPR